MNLKSVAIPAHEVAFHRPRYGKKTWSKALHAQLQDASGFPTEATARAAQTPHVPLSVFRKTATGFEHKDTTWSDRRWCPMLFAICEDGPQ